MKYLLMIAIAVCIVTSASHAQMRVLGGNPLLNISSAFPGQEPLPVTNTTCSLRWRRETVITKITVVSRCPGQQFDLKVEATNSSDGTPAAEVQLRDGMLAADLIVNIPANGAPNKTCTLLYTATATFAQGNSNELGSDTHTITYTVVGQ